MPVTANLDCQLDHMWNHHPKSGPPLLVSVYIKGYKRRKLLLFVYLPSFSMVNPPTLSLKQFFNGLEPTFLEFECRLKTSSSRGLQHQIGNAKTSSFLDWTIIRLLAFPSGDSHCWTTQTTAIFSPPELHRFRGRLTHVANWLTTRLWPWEKPNHCPWQASPSISLALHLVT